VSSDIGRIVLALLHVPGLIVGFIIGLLVTSMRAGFTMAHNAYRWMRGEI
jgi:hypothetical protein